MKQRDKDQQSRRHFLRSAACAQLGYAGLVSALSQMRLFNASASAQGGGDYKALVCLFLFGGNDSNNTLIPFSGTHRNRYNSKRGILNIPAGDLARIYPDNDGEAWGLHPSCTDMADLFNAGKLGIVQNVGTLAYPVANRAEYTSGNVPLPPQLFSHSDQQIQWQSSVPDRPYETGWGGRVADLLDAGYNSGNAVSMSVSLSGINSFQVGKDVVQYVVDKNGATSLWGYGPASNRYRDALEGDGSYKNTWQGNRLKRFEEIMNFSHSNLQEESYNEVVRRARDYEGTVGAALTEAATSAVDFDVTFANAQTNLGDQLKMISKLIAGRGSMGNNRQVYFCSVGGYDTHASQLANHGNLMSELSTGLKAFQDTMDGLGVSDDVMLFECSDFTRTFTPNGTSTTASGSDHGWGGHKIVMGGPVKGKNLYGKFPNLTPGGPDDADNTRGRWIPSTSVDQYSSMIARWFGADSNSIETIFPNLSRFDDPLTVSTAKLDFIDFTV